MSMKMKRVDAEFVIQRACLKIWSLNWTNILHINKFNILSSGYIFRINNTTI